MPNSNKVLQEIQEEASKNPKGNPFNTIRKKYLQKLFEKRKRNIIAYYSAWLQRPPYTGFLEINDNDKNFFMSAVHGLNHKKGLDLILHTPGGEVAATESLVYYLKKVFDSDIEVFVPQIAMSAGTMIACAAKVIYMGKQSNLGPIDPQIGGVPASAILDEFKKAAEEIKKDPLQIPLWQVIIGKYHPSLMVSCENAMLWSKEIVKRWLTENMHPREDELCEKIAKKLSDHQEMKTHSRHISFDEARKIKLKVSSLEEDQELQDIVLSIHHAYVHTLISTNILKIIENHEINGQTLILTPASK